MVTPGSTAGVEQNFSRLKRFLGEHWQGSEVAEERRLVLQLAQSALPAADKELRGKARLMWASTFGEPRRGQSGKLWRNAQTQLQETVQNRCRMVATPAPGLHCRSNCNGKSVGRCLVTSRRCYRPGCGSVSLGSMDRET